jgi:hypothetical protein
MAPGAAGAVLGLWGAAAALLALQVLLRSPIRPGLGAGALAGLALLPAALELALPVGLLAGAVLAGVRLRERGELVALSASGAPFRRLAPALVAVGLLGGVLQAALGHELAPRGRAAARDTLQGSLASLQLRPGQPVVVGRDALLVRAGGRDAAGDSTDLFVAAGDLVVAAAAGRVTDRGRLVLTRGEARHLDPAAGWRLRFDQATVPLTPSPGRVELGERSSPHLADLVRRMRARGRDADYEALWLMKRTTAAAALPLLLLLGLPAGARWLAPGATVALTTVGWWTAVRLADKLVSWVGPEVAAAAPVVLLSIAAAAVWSTWRGR